MVRRKFEKMPNPTIHQAKRAEIINALEALMSLGVVKKAGWMLEWPLSRTGSEFHRILTGFAAPAKAGGRKDPAKPPYAAVRTRPEAGKRSTAAIYLKPGV